MNIISKYPLKIIKKSTKKRKYAVGMLVYPGVNNNWSYLFGACMNAIQLKKNDWFKNNCDIIILTPKISDDIVFSIIRKVFDVHIIYENGLDVKGSLNSVVRWNGVFNKLYFWNKNIFNYNRLLILDTDLFILESQDYIELLTRAEGPVAGCYENGYRYSNNELNLTRINVILDKKYTYYKWEDGKTYYNMVNAGVISLKPNTKTFSIFLKDLEDGWEHITKKYRAFKYRPNGTFYPEQEYLTGYYSGVWRTIPRKFISCETTSCHYSPSAIKYWIKFPQINTRYEKVTKESYNFTKKYPECNKIFLSIIKRLENTYRKSRTFVNNINNIKHINGNIVPIRSTKQTNKHNNNITIINRHNIANFNNNNNNNNIDKSVNNITNFNKVNELLFRMNDNHKINKLPSNIQHHVNMFKDDKKDDIDIENIDDPDELITMLNFMDVNNDTVFV